MPAVGVVGVIVVLVVRCGASAVAALMVLAAWTFVAREGRAGAALWVFFLLSGGHRGLPGK